MIGLKRKFSDARIGRGLLHREDRLHDALQPPSTSIQPFCHAPKMDHKPGKPSTRRVKDIANQGSVGGCALHSGGGPIPPVQELCDVVQRIVVKCSENLTNLAWLRFDEMQVFLCLFLNQSGYWLLEHDRF